jgi:murein L,D-transpeptidase YafK
MCCEPGRLAYFLPLIGILNFFRNDLGPSLSYQQLPPGNMRHPSRSALFLALIIALPGAFIAPLDATTPQSDRLRAVRTRVEPSLKEELTAAGFALGNPAFIRIFKEEGELELWLKPKGEKQFKLWKTWPIAAMSGKLGPKEKVGDLQAPEGFYAVNAKAMNPVSNYHLSFNIGYPNAFDQALGRTGSHIMIHGNQVSIGCFAMSDPVIEPIYLVVESALNKGQAAVPIHAFPFRMTDERMARAEMEGSAWLPFWKNLRDGYKRFETELVPPPTKPDGEFYAFD